MEAFIDVADLYEDERIRQIGETTMALPVGKTVGFVTDDEEGKADRYIRKLLKRFPELQVKSRFDGPVANTVSVVVGRVT